MSESYFQTKRHEELAEVRKHMAEVQRYVLAAGPDYIRHEKKYPGRIAHFMDQAAAHLEEAERMIMAMAPGRQQKGFWIAFSQTLELADHCVRQALWDPSVQRDLVRQEATRKPRRTEINEWIEGQLRRQNDAKSPVLWGRAPEWLTEQVGYDAFTKRVTKVRGTLGLKR